MQSTVFEKDWRPRPAPPIQDSWPRIATEDPGSARTLSILGAVTLGLISAWFAWGPQPALWFQPTAVGITWGGVFLVGFALGSTAAGKLRSAIWGLIVSYCGLMAFASLTQIAFADSLFCTALVLFGGWLTAAQFPRENRAGEDGAPPVHRMWRWSIWDMAFLTLVAACLSHCLPKLTTAPLLLLSVVAALIGGVTCCWLACRWVCNDGWTLFSVALAVGSLLVVTAGVCAIGLPGPSPWQSLRWALCGPLNVISSQAVTVTAAVALMRFEHSSWWEMVSRHPSKKP